MAKANKIVYYGTGRRKSSVARVRLVEGSGKITINGKDIEEFSDVETFRDKNELKPVPRDNPAYIDLIVKKHKLSPYTNDINDAIPLVESMIEAINHNLNIQKFVARVNAFNDWMSYFKSKYKDKPEAYYISFQKLVEIDFQSHYLATIKYESRLYNPYLPYSAEGAMYSPKAIQTQTNALLVELKKTLEILKDVN